MPLVIFLPLVVFPTLSNETGSLRSPVLQSTTLLVTADLSAKVLLPVASPKLCSCYCNHIQEQGKVSNFCLISTSVQFFHVQRYPAALPIFSSMSKETKWLLYSSLVWEQDRLNCACQTNVCLVICSLSVGLRRPKTLPASHPDTAPESEMGLLRWDPHCLSCFVPEDSLKQFM